MVKNREPKTTVCRRAHRRHGEIEFRGHGTKKSMSPEFPGSEVHVIGVIRDFRIRVHPCESVVSGRGSAFVIACLIRAVREKRVIRVILVIRRQKKPDTTGQIGIAYTYTGMAKRVTNASPPRHRTGKHQRVLGKICEKCVTSVTSVTRRQKKPYITGQNGTAYTYPGSAVCVT